MISFKLVIIPVFPQAKEIPSHPHTLIPSYPHTPIPHYFPTFLLYNLINQVASKKASLLRN